MNEIDAEVLAYYERNAEREHLRLERADCGLEFELTTRILAAHIPPGARVLEVGGGSGRYARWLAARGCRVVFTDFSPALVALAREYLGGETGIEDVEVADARDLSRWSAGEFDAVVALGPFYHLVAEDDRRRAAAEIARVLRPSGTACIALIPRHAVFRGLLADPAGRARLHDAAFMARVLEEGVFINDQPGRFTGVYGVDPRHPEAVLASTDLLPVATHAIEGFVGDLQSAAADLQIQAPPAYAALLDALHASSTDPSFFGTTNHLLLVAQKRGP